MDTERFDRDRLVTEAVEQTGLDDFGEPTWQDGLDRLLDDLSSEARLHELGVEIAAGDVADYLAIRLGITAHRAEHPEVGAAPVDAPIFIVGQPRTGTTILHDLLAQDPRLRAPLTWEVDRPLPPPDPETFDTDPRIADVQSTLEGADALIPGFTDFHPMGALHAQECVRMTAGDFRSMIFNTQYRVPNYNRWLLHEADVASAYRWHRQYLQHLQARQSPQQWLLKSPAHLWHFDALLAEYPDAVIVQTHRDPLKVIASISALVAHLRQMASDSGSLPEIADSFSDDVFVGLERSITARDEVLSDKAVIDVQFTDFMSDPIPTVRAIYEQLDLDLDDAGEHRLRSFLDSHPGDGGGGGSRYRFSDTGLDADDLRERARHYQDRFAVPSEPVV
jgi:hypothetical protein